MRALLAIAAFAVAVFPAVGQEPISAPGDATARAEVAATPCNGKQAKACGVSTPDLKQARKLYQQGMRLKTSDPEQALTNFEDAVHLVPRATEFVVAREMLRQQLAYVHIQRGNDLMQEKRSVEAAAEFRRALELSPGDDVATQRLHEIASAELGPKPSFIEPSPEAQTITLQPRATRQSFHTTDDVRGLYNTVATAFGIKANIDPSVRPIRVRLDLDNADFYTAVASLTALTRTFYVPVSYNEMTVAADTPVAHKELDRWLLRTFYLPEVTTPQELNDIVNLMRTLFEVRFVTQQPASSTITVRAPAPVMEALTQFLGALATGRPQVMLEFDAYEVNRQTLQTLGVTLPLQFNVFNIPASALTALGGQNAQDLINQLIASGGINQANTSAISALIAQLQSQQNSIFSQPVATFGGGKTLMGIGVPPSTVNFSRNDSRVINLEHLTMRAAQGDAATFRLGTRYPILNGTYAPVFNTPQIANVIGGSGYVAPFPSFSYEDLGLTVKAKPRIHSGDVTLELELEVRALGGQSFNGVPVISQRAYKGVITVKNDQPAVVAGQVSETEQKTLSGLPGFSRIPLLNTATSSKQTEHDRDELLIVITPHIISLPPSGSTAAIRVPVQ